MPIIDLNNVFPPAKDGTRGPLPKQREFMAATLDPKGPKYIAYYGGVGSGKSLILCINILTQAVMNGGEYVIARQFMPELRRTTMKQFIEICPKELIIEHRIADAEVKLKSANGKTATIYFVGLEDPDKLRSLNLSGFGIDEASQVSENAFLLLQGRLRNPNGLRKGILVGNPAGHNYVYNYFIKQDFFTTPEAKKQYKILIAPSTENVHLPDGYVESMLQTYSKERVQREIMGSFDVFEGQIYHEFNRHIHVVEPFDIPKHWTRIIGADHGYTNPAAFLWGAVDGDGNIYIYREFYQSSWLIKEIVKGKQHLKGIVELSGNERIEGVYIDPSVRRSNAQSGESDMDSYLEHLPRTWSMIPANNEVATGIDRVKTYLKVDERTRKPRLFIFNTCTNLIDELVQYRYEELPESQRGFKNEREQPRKYKDHACDALRYLIMSRPEAPVKDNPMKKYDHQYPTLEHGIVKELYGIRKPEPKDPFGDT